LAASERRRYEIHYDVEFKPPFKKAEVEKRSNDLFELVRKASTSFHVRPKIEDEFITLTIERNELSIWIESFIHFEVEIGHVATNILNKINAVSKEVLAYASSQTDHMVNSTTIHIEADTPVRKRSVAQFIQSTALAQFNSNLKINADPGGIALSSMEGDAEILYILLDDQKHPWGSIVYSKVQKELPWDLPTLITEEIDKRTAKLTEFVVK
jgi:hypothetical protein